MLKKWGIQCAISVLVFWAYTQGYIRTLDPDAPDTALEYFRTPDEQGYLAVYDDAIEAEGGLWGEGFSIKIEDIETFKRDTNNVFDITTKNNEQLHLDFGVLGRPYANRFEKTMNDLLYEREA